MNDTEINPTKCPRCGTPLPANAPEGLCPRCVVAANLSAETEVNAAETGPSGTIVIKPAPAPPPAPEEIAKLFPQLEILEALGRGGMGAVYKARQPKLDRFVALKILSQEKKDDPQFAERFQLEARTLARLHHPNIVAIHDFGETQGIFYLLMEFVDGMTLRQLLQKRSLTPAEALVIVPKICEALQYAHQQGVVHRDIKPENILLDKQGQVKIADFGIAKIVGQQAQTGLTQDQQVIGTPHYMAPEQVEHPQTVDHRADIYSLGVVLYEMLTSELPLGKFAPPSRKVQVDVRLDEVVLRALEKEPDRRYQQARQVKTDMETISSGSQPLQSPVGIARETGPANESEKAILPAFLLAFFFGIFGAHRFYVGKIWTGLLQLGAAGAWVLMIIACATTGSHFQPTLGILLGFPVFGCIIMATIDWILLLCKAFTDGHGRKIINWVNPNTTHVRPGGGTPITRQPGVPPVYGATPNPPTHAQKSATPNQPPITPMTAVAAETLGTGKITAPGVGLMIVGLWIFFHGIVGLVFLTGWEFSFPGLTTLPFWGPNFGHQFSTVASASIVVFQIVPSLLILFGGFQMVQLRSYAWSLAAAILSIVACSWIGFPVGIWALVVLIRPDGRAAFAKNENSSPRSASTWPWIIGSAGLLLVLLLAVGAMALARTFADSKFWASAASDGVSDEPGVVEVVDNGTSDAGDAALNSTNDEIAPAVASPSGSNVVKRTIKSGTAASFARSFVVAPDSKLTMKVDRGDIRVTGSDDGKIEVRVTREVTRADAAETAKVIKEHQIELRQRGNEISITAQPPASLRDNRLLGLLMRPNLKVRYEVALPRDCIVQLDTIGGNIEASDLRGELKAKTSGGNLTFSAVAGRVDGQTSGGDVHVRDCKGELVLNTSGGTVGVEGFSGPFLHARTMGGDISADFETTPKADCDLNTSGGTVTAKLPSSAAFNLEAHTLGGSVTSEFAVLTEGKQQANSLHGAANGGGPLLKLETMGGDIRVLKK